MSTFSNGVIYHEFHVLKKNPPFLSAIQKRWCMQLTVTSTSGLQLRRNRLGISSHKKDFFLLPSFTLTSLVIDSRRQLVLFPLQCSSSTTKLFVRPAGLFVFFLVKFLDHCLYLQILIITLHWFWKLFFLSYHFDVRLELLILKFPVKFPLVKLIHLSWRSC
jgi:hypothetical protein